MQLDNLKLVMFCGDYTQAMKQHDFGFINAVVISQTTESGNEVLKRGREYYKELGADGCAAVFCNNENFLYGLRLSVKDGNLHPGDIRFVYFNSADDAYQVVFINKDGKLSHWPIGFFDSIDKALSELI
jgi:hypothetical protein